MCRHDEDLPAKAGRRHGRRYGHGTRAHHAARRRRLPRADRRRLRPAHGRGRSATSRPRTWPRRSAWPRTWPSPVHGSPRTGTTCPTSVRAWRFATRSSRNISAPTSTCCSTMPASAGGGFVNGDRAEWERTFNVCWYGVYYCTRAFLALLVASDEGCIINTSSVNGFWASLGPSVSHTAYPAAKFAVKGFTEALITDLRLNAPHVKAVLVMAGHIGTSILFNSPKVLGKPDALNASAEDLATVRAMLERRGLPADAMTDDQLRAAMHQMAVAFRDNAPTSAAQAATTILEGVRTDTWRVLVGQDAQALDRLVREAPELAYEPSFAKALSDQGHMRLLE